MIISDFVEGRLQFVIVGCEPRAFEGGGGVGEVIKVLAQAGPVAKVIGREFQERAVNAVNLGEDAVDVLVIEIIGYGFVGVIFGFRESLEKDVFNAACWVRAERGAEPACRIFFIAGKDHLPAKRVPGVTAPLAQENSRKASIEAACGFHMGGFMGEGVNGLIGKKVVWRFRA